MKIKTNWMGLLSLALFASFLYACSSAPSSKGEYLTNYEAFIKDVKANKAGYTAEQWEEKDKEFQRFSEELGNQFEGDLSLIEKGKLAKFALQYTTARSASAFQEITDVIKSDEFKNAFKEFRGIWDKELKGEFGSAVQELEGVWNDELRGELSGNLDELKALLDNEEFREELKGKIDDVKAIINDKELEGKIKSAADGLQEVLQDIETEMDKVVTE